MLRWAAHHASLGGDFCPITAEIVSRTSAGGFLMLRRQGAPKEHDALVVGALGHPVELGLGPHMVGPTPRRHRVEEPPKLRQAGLADIGADDVIGVVLPHGQRRAEPADKGLLHRWRGGRRRRRTGDGGA